MAEPLVDRRLVRHALEEPPVAGARASTAMDPNDEPVPLRIVPVSGQIARLRRRNDRVIVAGEGAWISSPRAAIPPIPTAVPSCDLLRKPGSGRSRFRTASSVWRHRRKVLE
jgi:hypothetical protein